MLTQNKSIHKLNKYYKLQFPSNNEMITMQSPAMLIFTDFKKIRPLVIDSKVSIDQAEEIMELAHVRLKLVLDKEGNITGIVTYQDLIGEKAIKIESIERIPRCEITVAEVMTPLVDLKGIDREELENLSIDEFLKLLKNELSHHFLVVNANETHITGLVSAKDIIRKLKLPFKTKEDCSFKSIYSYVTSNSGLNTIYC